MPVATITADTLIRDHANDLAYVAEMTTPATDLVEFSRHLAYATDNFSLAGINGAEDLATAVTLLLSTQAETNSDARERLLLRAAVLLKIVPDMTGEYRDMVGD